MKAKETTQSNHSSDETWTPQAPNECCRDLENLLIVESSNSFLVKQCKCGRKHRRLKADTGKVFSRGEDAR